MLIKDIINKTVIKNNVWEKSKLDKRLTRTAPANKLHNEFREFVRYLIYIDESAHDAFRNSILNVEYPITEGDWYSDLVYTAQKHSINLLAENKFNKAKFVKLYRKLNDLVNAIDPTSATYLDQYGYTLFVNLGNLMLSKQLADRVDSIMKHDARNLTQYNIVKLTTLSEMYCRKLNVTKEEMNEGLTIDLALQIGKHFTNTRSVLKDKMDYNNAYDYHYLYHNNLNINPYLCTRFLNLIEGYQPAKKYLYFELTVSDSDIDRLRDIVKERMENIAETHVDNILNNSIMSDAEIRFLLSIYYPKYSKGSIYDTRTFESLYFYVFLMKLNYKYRGKITANPYKVPAYQSDQDYINLNKDAIIIRVDKLVNNQYMIMANNDKMSRLMKIFSYNSEVSITEISKVIQDNTICSLVMTNLQSISNIYRLGILSNASDVKLISQFKKELKDQIK